MKKLLMIVTIAGLTGSAFNAAAAQQGFMVARDLGNLLASEELCGLSYDQQAISDYISNNVQDTDLGFNESLSTSVWSIKLGFDKMSASEKTAHCAQTVRAAKRYKFTH